MKEVKIGKFDIFAVFMYATALSQGMKEDDAKVHGFSIAVLGAQAKMGYRKSGGKMSDTAAIAKAAGQKKKRGTIVPSDFDKLIDKMGNFYAKHFLPKITKMVDKGMSYDQVKARVAIPATWGAKLSGDDFIANTKGIR